MLPGYIEKIANELKEIKDVMKDNDKQIWYCMGGWSLMNYQKGNWHWHIETIKTLELMQYEAKLELSTSKLIQEGKALVDNVNLDANDCLTLIKAINNYLQDSVNIQKQLTCTDVEEVRTGLYVELKVV